LQRKFQKFFQAEMHFIADLSQIPESLSDWQSLPHAFSCSQCGYESPPLVFVSHRTSSCWTRRDKLPDTLSPARHKASFTAIGHGPQTLMQRKELLYLPVHSFAIQVKEIFWLCIGHAQYAAPYGNVHLIADYSSAQINAQPFQSVRSC
jgi:hypothetical protein